MITGECINLINSFRHKHPHFEQIFLYPDIALEIINPVIEAFPEYDFTSETPLAFYRAADPYDHIPNWILLTDSRLYYSANYYPYPIHVQNTISIIRINDYQFKASPFLDGVIRINGKKVGTFTSKINKEVQIFSDIVGILLESIKSSNKEFPEGTPEVVDEDLENYRLFTLAREYFDEVNLGGKLWGFSTFYYGRFIPEEKLEEARIDYANYDTNQEKPVIYYDNSWVGAFSEIESSGFLNVSKGRGC